MKIYRKFEKVFVLLLVFFILCFVKAAIAAENPSTGAPAEIKSSTAAAPQFTASGYFYIGKDQPQYDRMHSSFIREICRSGKQSTGCNKIISQKFR